MIDSLSIVFPAYNENQRLKDCFDDIKRLIKKHQLKELNISLLMMVVPILHRTK